MSKIRDNLLDIISIQRPSYSDPTAGRKYRWPRWKLVNPDWENQTPNATVVNYFAKCLGLDEIWLFYIVVCTILVLIIAETQRTSIVILWTSPERSLQKYDCIRLKTFSFTNTYMLKPPHGLCEGYVIICHGNINSRPNKSRWINSVYAIKAYRQTLRPPMCDKPFQKYFCVDSEYILICPVFKSTTYDSFWHINKMPCRSESLWY